MGHSSLPCPLSHRWQFEELVVSIHSTFNNKGLLFPIICQGPTLGPEETRVSKESIVSAFMVIVA